VETFPNPETIQQQFVKVYNEFHKIIFYISNYQNNLKYYALKILHDLKEARDPELAKERIKNEIKAMSTVSHPNLLPIVDFDPDGRWFGSPFYSKGVLSKHINLYCKYGIHDLSRIDYASGFSRFNMPLELRIFIGCQK
jgi:hypothetical protein